LFPARVICRTPRSIAPRQNAEAVMLDFVNPTRAGRRWRERVGRLDNSQPGAGTLTQRHARDLESRGWVESKKRAPNCSGATYRRSKAILLRLLAGF
jgi:hypothetical protein